MHIKGFLVHKKPLPSRTVQQAYACDPRKGGALYERGTPVVPWKICDIPCQQALEGLLTKTGSRLELSSVDRPGSLEKPPDLDPFFYDLTRARSAKELKEHLETRVL